MATGIPIGRLGPLAVALGIGAAMAISGACALVIGLTFGGPVWLTLLVALVWGVTVVSVAIQPTVTVTPPPPPDSPEDPSTIWGKTRQIDASMIRIGKPSRQTPEILINNLRLPVHSNYFNCFTNSPQWA